MNNKIRHILSQHEVPPPAGTWQTIADELDLFDSLNPVGKKLAEAEIAPPVQSWNRILNKLEENSLADKLYTAEVLPPATTWKKISDELNGAPVLPLKRPPFTWMKYTAAAAVFLFIAWGAMNIYTSRSSGTDLTVQTGPGQQKEELPPATTTKEVLNELVTGVRPSNESDEARNDAALEASKKTVAKVDLNSPKIAREVSGFYFNAASDPGTRGLNPDLPLTEANDQADRYFMLMTPEGNIIRVSKKLGGMVCCISGETDDPACMDQLKKWREKIVSSSLGHSADSFMDLLMLVNTASEEEQD